VTDDRNGLEILDRSSCLELLGTADVGRIALSIGALPVVLPVNFAMLGEDIVIRTSPGSRLETAATNAVVAFEVDCVDASHSGWSVLVQGVATEITDPLELRQARLVHLNSWPGGDGRLLRLVTQIVSGRRFKSARAG
jgi:uncharacterized protein